MYSQLSCCLISYFCILALHFNLLGRACHALLALLIKLQQVALCTFASKDGHATPRVDKLVRFLIVFSWRASATQVAAVCLTPSPSALPASWAGFICSPEPELMQSFVMSFSVLMSPLSLPLSL